MKPLPSELRSFPYQGTPKGKENGVGSEIFLKQLFNLSVYN